MPGTDDALGRSLRTERVSVGSVGLMIDPENGAELAWPSTSVIAIIGPGRDAGWARLADDAFSGAFREGVAIRSREGTRTLALSEEQVRRLVTMRADQTSER